MGLNKKTVDDINVKGLRVLCRCDFNVPLKDGKLLHHRREPSRCSSSYHQKLLLLIRRHLVTR